MNKATIFWGLGIAGLLAVTLWWWIRPAAIVVETAYAQRGSLEVTVDNQGHIRVHDKYVIAAPVAGELERIELHDGDTVKKGQLLAILKPLPMDVRQRQQALAQLESAQARSHEASQRTLKAIAELRLATDERIRIEQLIKEAFVSGQAAEKAVINELTSRDELVAARFREEAARAEVKLAKAALLGAENGTQRVIKLLSPISGRILRIHEKSERTVTPGMAIVTVADLRKFEVVVDVLTIDAVKIVPGALMRLEQWGGNGNLRALVRNVEPAAFSKVSALGVEEQRVNVIGELIDPVVALGDGYRVEARIIIWSAGEVLKIPVSSLFRVGEDWHVFVVSEGRAVKRKVIIGQRNSADVQIINGLELGSQVIRFPSNQISEGVKVKIANDF